MKKLSIIFLLSLTAQILFGANYKPIPVFTEEFIRKDGLTQIPLHVDTGDKKYADNWTVSGGVPIPKGELVSEKNVRVLNAQKKEIPFQVRPLAWWEAKKSIKWLEVQFTIQKDEIDPVYYLEYGKNVKPEKFNAIKVTDNDDYIEINTGSLSARISKKRGSLIESIIIGKNDEVLKKPISSYIKLRDIEGDRSGLYSTIKDVSNKKSLVFIEQQGPETVTVLIKAWHVSDSGKRTFPVDVRLTFFRDQPRIKIFHTFYISENPAIVLIPTMGIDIPLNFSGKASAGVDGKDIPLGNDFSLWQDSSEIPTYPKCNQFKPFCKIFENDRKSSLLFSGKKTDGWIRIIGNQEALTVTMRRMWEEFPKGFQYHNGDLKVEFWPEIKPQPMDFRRIDQRFPDDYQLFKKDESKKIRGYYYNMKVYHRQMYKRKELNGSALGRAKSHELWLDFSSHNKKAKDLAFSAKRPLIPFVTPAWNRFTNVLGVFHPEDTANFPKTEKSWETSWDTLIAHQTKWQNWYGMYNWGDFQTNYKGATEDRWGYYNTKYSWTNGGKDIPYSIFLWYLRSGKRKYFDLAEIASLQLIDVSCKHPRAWSDERLLPKDWSGAGSSRYDKNHWGSGGGLDTEHTFSHSVQMNWLLTGNTHTRDLMMEWAGHFYNNEKIFNRRKMGQATHYHDRSEDMCSKLAANAYENDPLDPRWQEMLDSYIKGFSCAFKSMYLDKSGKPMRSCNKNKVITFYYTLYKVQALNYLLTVKDYPELVKACKHGIPLRYADESGGGLSFYLLYLMTGNVNYAKFAARQSTRYGSLNSINKNTRLMMGIMGGEWATFPGLLECVVKADLKLHPEEYDQRELNYYPLAEKGSDNKWDIAKEKYASINLSSVFNSYAGSEQGTIPNLNTKETNEDPSKGTVVFDFGMPSRHASGTLPVSKSTHYPATSNVKKGFSALPFGARALFNNIPFSLPTYKANDSRGVLIVEDGKSYTVSVGSIKTEKLFLLTGVSLAEDPFHKGVGAIVSIKYKDGETEKFNLINMVHYQFKSFLRLYFSREFYAGRLNDFSISVVGFPTKGKAIESVTIGDAGKKARLAIFAMTAELKEANSRKPVISENINTKSKDKIIYKKELPNGLYNIVVDFSMSTPLGSPLDIFLQNQLVVNHAVPVARTVYEFPVEVTDGTLRLELLPGEIHHKARSKEAEINLHAVHIYPLKKRGIIQPVKATKGAAKLRYGWRLRGERAVIHDILGSAYKDKENRKNSEKLLTWDAGYLDKYGIGKAEFIVDLPNGEYEVDATLMIQVFGDAGSTSEVKVNIEGESELVTLPQFKVIGFRKSTPQHTVYRKKVTVKDGQLNIIISLPKKEERKNTDSCGISALTIREINR
jgi:exo-rhamnogalacturonan lyase-like protein